MVKNTIERLLKDGVNMLEVRDYNNPLLDAQLILSHLLKKDKMYLFLHKDEEINESVCSSYYDMIQKRNIGYPLQYMTNSQEFMGLDFYVQDSVLIPRPDTETLVEKIINIANKEGKTDQEIHILDIGTGSGAIAVSLGHYLKNALVTAVDISDVAIETANVNANRHTPKNVNVIKGDIFGNLNINNKKFNIVVSNPPYIESDEIAGLQTEVSKYEPMLALDGGTDGLDFYRQTVKVFKEICLKKAILSVEIGYNQGSSVAEIFKDAQIFSSIEIDKDLNNHDRVVTGFL